MAAKRQKTLFEAIRASKPEAVRGLDVDVNVPRPGEDVGPMDLGLRVERAGPRRLVVVVVLVAVAAVAAFLIVRRAGHERFEQDRSLQSVDEVSRGPVREDVLANSGPASLGSEMYVYDADAESAESAGGGSAVGQGPVTPEEGQWRVRIYMASKSKKDVFDAVVKFLEERGLPTTAEYRKGFYFLYTKRTFPSDTHADTLATLERIKELGKEYFEASGTPTDFSDAYAVKRSGN